MWAIENVVKYMKNKSHHTYKSQFEREFALTEDVIPLTVQQMALDVKRPRRIVQ